MTRTADIDCGSRFQKGRGKFGNLSMPLYGRRHRLTVFATEQFLDLLTVLFTMQAIDVRVDCRRYTTQQHQRLREPAAQVDIAISGYHYFNDDRWQVTRHEHDGDHDHDMNETFFLLRCRLIRAVLRQDRSPVRHTFEDLAVNNIRPQRGEGRKSQQHYMCRKWLLKCSSLLCSTGRK